MINFNLEVLGRDGKVISSEKRHIIHTSDMITVYDINEKTTDLRFKVWAQWDVEDEEYTVNIASDFVPLVALRDKIYGTPPRKGTMFVYEDEDGNKRRLELDTKTASELEGILVKDESIKSFYQVFLYAPQATVNLGMGKGAGEGSSREQRAAERQRREEERKRQEEEKKRQEEDKKRQEEEKKRQEEEKKRQEEEKKKQEEEEKKRMEEEQKRQAEEKIRVKEEKLQQEKEEIKQIKEDERKRREEEERQRIEEEKTRKELEELAKKHEEERKKAEKEERRRLKEQAAFENAPKLPSFIACFFPIKDEDGHYVKIVMRTRFVNATA